MCLQDDRQPDHKTEEPSNQQLKVQQLSLTRNVADELCKNHCPIWGNMNNLPMRADIFEHTDVNGKMQFLTNELGIVTMEDMHLTNCFSHKCHINKLAEKIVEFLKDDFGKVL